MICQTARYRVQPDGIDESLAAIEEFTKYVTDNEAGTVVYSVYRSTDDPLEFLHVIEFRDEAAHQVHGSSAGVKRFQDRLYPRLQTPVQFDAFDLVAAK